MTITFKPWIRLSLEVKYINKIILLYTLGHYILANIKIYKKPLFSMLREDVCVASSREASMLRWPMPHKRVGLNCNFFF